MSSELHMCAQISARGWYNCTLKRRESTSQIQQKQFGYNLCYICIDNAKEGSLSCNYYKMILQRHHASLLQHYKSSHQRSENEELVEKSDESAALFFEH